MSHPADFAPVRIGVAGLGRAGTFHIERLGLRDDSRVVALYDDCLPARERAGGLQVPLHAGWSDFLNDDRIELVLLATPPALHAEQAVAALAAGKHVVVETPMCLNLFEADAISAAAERSGRLVSVAHTRRWDDDFVCARKLLAEGELGRPVAIKLINWQYNPRRRFCPPVSGRTAAVGLAALEAGWNAASHWREHSSTGGGVLWEFGIHYFDQLLQLAGRNPESVYGRLSASGVDGTLDNGFLAIVNFPGGLTAHVEVSRAHPAPLSTGWIIAGDAGSYVGLTQYTATADGEVVDLPVSPAAPDADEFYELLARHVRLGEANPVSPDDARRPIALVEAVRKSARSGNVVPFEL